VEISKRTGCLQGASFDFNLGADRLHLGLDLLGLVLGNPLFDRFWGFVHQCLGFLESQRGNRPDFFDDLNFFLSPALVRITSNSVFSSAAGAAAWAGAAAIIAKGAAAETPNFSSSSFTN